MPTSGRNKTINTSLEEGKCFLNRCIHVKHSISFEDVIDHTILGDIFEVAQFLPKNFVDLLIVDPPYNLDKNFHGVRFKESTDHEYESYTESWVQAILPILKENASIYVCCDWRSSLPIASVLRRYFHIQNRITWQREKGRGALSNWKNGMEDIWFATCSKNYTFNVDKVKIRRRVVAPYTVNGVPKDWERTQFGNFRNTHPSNFWDDISIPYWSMPENTAHPTQKPEKLLAKLILASSNPGDVVFDPFLGSGSTSVTAKKLQRHFVGVELNPQYCVWAEERLQKANHDTSIQGFSDGVFWERNTSALQKKSFDNNQLSLWAEI